MRTLVAYLMFPVVVVLILWVYCDWRINKGTLKDSVKRVLKALRGDFKDLTAPESPPRQNFTPELTNEFCAVVKEYAEPSFEPVARQYAPEALGRKDIPPFIAVSFVPNHQLADDEAVRIKGLLTAKYRAFLDVYVLALPREECFVVRGQSNGPYELFCLYYVEFDVDREPYKAVHDISVRKATHARSRRPLTDARLDRELEGIV